MTYMPVQHENHNAHQLTHTLINFSVSTISVILLFGCAIIIASKFILIAYNLVNCLTAIRMIVLYKHAINFALHYLLISATVFIIKNILFGTNLYLPKEN